MSPLAPVVEELFTARFQAVVEEMGELLRRTALSTNVKERLDFSCALLGSEGELVANAPHMPVHLGALGACARAVVEVLPLGPGDVAVTNSPAFAGSHLPDLTVISPVYEGEDEVDDSGVLLGYVASRAHHAEIGGTRPGSMPPEATTLEEEGVVLAPFKLVEAGEPRFDRLEERLSGARYPSRSVPENLADVEAAVAAGHRGAAGLRALAAAHGREVVAEQMTLLARRAGRRVAAALERLIPEGQDTVRLAATEHLDDGTPLAVAFTITRVEETGGGATAASAHVSFEGSGPVHPGNLNTTRAVVRSALLYVLRLLVDEPLPLNEGLLGPVTLEIPSPTILDPFGSHPNLDPAEAPAVVGGNTETSQRIVDTLCRALRIAAGSQGTMNNTLFGNDRFGYYETVCGGSGATSKGPGASAVHTHMTNTRITDPEILERRYPVRLERFAVRRDLGGSGGAGLHRGGDGAVREITFLEELELSVLGQHRTEGPYGLDGGGAGALGCVRLVRAATGEVEELASVDGRTVRPGDRLVTETPGGGGWGRPDTTVTSRDEEGEGR